MVLPKRSDGNPIKRLDLVASLQGMQRTEEFVELHGESTVSSVQTGGGGGGWAGYRAWLPLQIKCKKRGGRCRELYSQRDAKARVTLKPGKNKPLFRKFIFGD